MERCTYFEGGKWRIRLGDTEYSGSWVDRLAAYEDAIPFDKLPRAAELVKADDKGLCMVLPCEPSAVTVYQLRSKKHALGVGISQRIVSCATVWGDGNYALHHQGADDCLKKDFGKTWFLTRAEAEAALGGGKDG
ncbi:hypothetical protein [Intestinibacillus massiliensis]|uniref:hypothetical protein n=1 Tax=Intestinibacillus massiliensis TaxID=1871029 RepID=UPI000B35C355|nr:hypothetical protein [Intestinibacillus massiliensis]